MAADGVGEYEVTFEALAGTEQGRLTPGTVAYIGTGVFFHPISGLKLLLRKGVGMPCSCHAVIRCRACLTLQYASEDAAVRGCCQEMIAVRCFSCMHDIAACMPSRRPGADRGCRREKIAVPCRAVVFVHA